MKRRTFLRRMRDGILAGVAASHLLVDALERMAPEPEPWPEATVAPDDSPWSRVPEGVDGFQVTMSNYMQLATHRRPSGTITGIRA